VEESVKTYPNRIPPKATNPLIRIAGHAFPAVPSGCLSRIPIAATNQTNRQAEKLETKEQIWLCAVKPGYMKKVQLEIEED
jgi:hypothetical protein